MAASCTSITDGRLAVLLEEVFLRLPTTADLVRASAACVYFRQLVTDRSFLRRFRKNHNPTFIGFLGWMGCCPALPPHSSASIASAVTSAADFSFSFLPRPTRYCFQLPPAGRWSMQSMRDGRALLDRGPKDADCLVFPELVVCDPLHRQYHLLPPIPDNLAELVRDPLVVGYKRCYNVILVPPGKEVQEEDKETSFRVIWMSQCNTKIVAFFYSSTTGQWQAIASKCWSDLLVDGLSPICLKSPLLGWCQYVYGCLYWKVSGGERELKNHPREVMLVLDTMSMEFSVADLPPGRWRGKEFGIVEAGEGRLGLLTLFSSYELSYFVRQNTDASSDKWQLEKIIPLDKLSMYRHSIIGGTERYLLIKRSNYGMDKFQCFSLDVKTFHLERVREIQCEVTLRFIYTSFPPSLSSTTV